MLKQIFPSAPMPTEMHVVFRHRRIWHCADFNASKFNGLLAVGRLIYVSLA
jgi:hypothetical protein